MSNISKRNNAIDLIKWLAMLTMAIDHLRFVWPTLSWTYLPGRLSFPFFCIAMAANVSRAPIGNFFSTTNVRYLGFLILFSILSEIPYELLTNINRSFNVFPSLILGLIIALGWHHKTRISIFWSLSAIGLTYICNASFMYGIWGVLLPAAIIIALRGSLFLWILPAILSLLANGRYLSYDNILHLKYTSLLALSISFIAPMLGLWVLRQKIVIFVPEVRRWGYLFYPAHLAIFYAIKIIS